MSTTTKTYTGDDDNINTTIAKNRYGDNAPPALTFLPIFLLISFMTSDPRKPARYMANGTVAMNVSLSFSVSCTYRGMYTFLRETETGLLLWKAPLWWKVVSNSLVNIFSRERNVTDIFARKGRTGCSFYIGEKRGTGYLLLGLYGMIKRQNIHKQALLCNGNSFIQINAQACNIWHFLTT